MRYRGLRLVRVARGLTAQALADRTGLRQERISEVETGRREPSGPELAALAHALGCPASLLTAESMVLSFGTARLEVL